MDDSRHDRPQRVSFRCKYCNWTFKTAEGLVKHKREDHAEEIRINQGRTFRTPSSTAARTRSKKSFLSSEDEWNPSEDNQSTASSSAKSSNNYDLKPESVTSSSVSEFKCRFCPETNFPTEDSLLKHERCHTGEKPYQCKYCLKGYQRRDWAESHEKKCPALKILMKEGSIKKTDSSHGDSDLNLLSSSSNVNSGGKQPENSDITPLLNDTKASSGFNLKKIYLTKSGRIDRRWRLIKNNYVCEICNASRHTERLLRKHQIAHSAERPFQCKYCGFRFKRQSNLNEHLWRSNRCKAIQQSQVEAY